MAIVVDYMMVKNEHNLHKLGRERTREFTIYMYIHIYIYKLMIYVHVVYGNPGGCISLNLYRFINGRVCLHILHYKSYIVVA